jgi:DNA-binding transcriptional regulator GbsR (MarR family)
MIVSTIRRRILGVLSAVNEPLTAKDIRERSNYPKEEGVILMALQAMQRDGLVREFHPGFYVNLDYRQPPQPIRPRKLNGKKRVKKTASKKKAVVNQQERTVVQKPEPKKPSPEETVDISVVNPKQDRIRRLHAELGEMRYRMEPLMIEDLELKLEVLDRLAGMFGLVVATMLREIGEDLRGLSEGAR